MNTKTVMLKLYNGDYVIGDENTAMAGEDEKIQLDNPRAFVFMPTMSGTMKAGFQPICMFSKKTMESITIDRSQVMVFVDNDEIPKEIINGYQSDVSGISIASASDIAAVNSASKNDKKGDFII